MKKLAGWGLGAAAAVALTAAVLPTATASAATPCPAGTDAVQVPYAWNADGTPNLAATVCVTSGGTRFVSMSLTSGWSADVKSDGSKGRTEVRFTDRATGARIDLRYEPGKTEIKS